MRLNQDKGKRNLPIPLWLLACAAAFQYLTRIPIPVQVPFTKELCRRSVFFYPLVGAVIGILLYVGATVLPMLVPSLPAAILLLILWVVLTGALHLDGVMDVADGVLCPFPLERRLEIMKDSRVGAMGVVACVLLLFLKASLLFSLLDEPTLTPLLPFLVWIPLWSRCFMVWQIAGWRYARQGEGMGTFFTDVGWSQALWSTCTALTCSILVILAWDTTGYLPWSDWYWTILAFVGITGTIGYLISTYLSRKLGGLTGDTYGATNELIETVLLASVVILGSWS